jgi:hypothetical protein
MYNLEHHLNHSEIINYPINYNKFPLATKCKFIKIELHENEYLYIPTFWNHWVFSEPNTVAISFDIENIEGSYDCNSEKQNNIIKKIPYVGYGNKFKFNYDNFINNSLNNYFNVLYSDTSDLSPIFKNKNQKKIFKNQKLNTIINTAIKYNHYTYIGQSDIPFNNNYKEITSCIDFDDTTLNNYEKNLFEYNFKSTFTDHNYNFKLTLDPKIWISLDKHVNSGLHHDAQSKFLYVLSGKKTVYLASPFYNEFLYFKYHDIVPKSSK